MPSLRRFRSRLSTAALLLLFLAACDRAPDPEPEPSPTASPSPTVAGNTVQIFLGTGDPNNCAAVMAVPRPVEGEPTLDKAMRALLAGPTPEEEGRALAGWFDERTADMLNSAVIAGGVAQVDFDDLREVIPNASSSCGSALLLAQLDGTAKQFPDVQRTLYSIDGDATTFYEWIQMSVPDA